MTQRINRLNQVKERTGLSRITLYSLIKEGKFSPPIPIGARAVGWLSSYVDAWIDALVKANRKMRSEALPTNRSPRVTAPGVLNPRIAPSKQEG